MDPIIFDEPGRIVVPVKIGDDDFELREATGRVAADYRSAIIRSEKKLPDGTIYSDNYADAELILVAGCLHGAKGIKPKDANPVPIHWLQTMPAKLIRRLFLKIREISQLDGLEEDTEESLQTQLDLITVKLKVVRAKKESDAKNSLPATQLGSA